MRELHDEAVVHDQRPGDALLAQALAEHLLDLRGRWGVGGGGGGRREEGREIGEGGQVGGRSWEEVER